MANKKVQSAKPTKPTKLTCGIENNDLAQNMNHDVVRVLALMTRPFTGDDVRDIYERFNFYLSSRKNDLQALLRQKIILPADVNNRYYGSTYYFYDYGTFFINPETIFDILRAIPEDRMPFYKSLIRSLNPLNKQYQDCALLGEALYNGLHGLSIDSKMAEACGDVYLDKYDDDDDYFYQKACSKEVRLYSLNLIPYMLQDKSMTAMLCSVTAEAKTIVADFILSHLADFNKRVSLHEDYYHLFFDDSDKPYNERQAMIYVLISELFTKGGVDALLKKYSAVEQARHLLQAVKDLHDGKTMECIKAITKLTDLYGLEFLQIPQLQFFLGAACLLDDSPAAMKLATKLYKSRIVKQNALMLRAVMEYKVKGDVSNTTVTDIDGSYPGSAGCHDLFALLVKHFQIITDKGLAQMYDKACDRILLTSRHDYLKLLFAAEDTESKDLYEELKRKTGMDTFLPHAEKKEEWELRLDRLLSAVGSPKEAKTAKNTSSARVVYLLHPHQNHVQPVLQKSSDGVNWTGGRNIALKTFAANKAEGMTSTDHAIASMVEVYSGYYGETTYTLEGNKVILQLVGHPNVYTDDSHRLKIDITQEPLQVSVSKDKDGGYSLRTNIILNEVSEGVYVDRSNATSIRVVPVSKQEAELVGMLDKLGALPGQAKTKLSELLTRLSGKMTVMSDLVAADKKDVKKAKASTLITVQLVPDGGSIRATLFAKPLTDTPPYLTPGQGIEFVSGTVKGKQVQAKRNLKEEAKNLAAVEQILQPLAEESLDDNVWQLSLEKTLALLDRLNTMKKEACVEWPEGVRMKVTRPQVMPADVHISVHKIGHWFEVEGEVTLDDKTQLKIAELLRLLRESQGRFIRLNDQEYVALSEHLAKQMKAIAHLTEAEKKGGESIKMSMFEASLFDELEKGGVGVDGDKAYRQLLENIAEADTIKFKTPKGIQADLRDYQKEGFQWLSRLSHWGAGACLADDMGLGKTLQSITLMHSRRAEGPSLVVAPTSVLLNWMEEIQRFSPSLRPILLNRAGSRAEVIENAGPSDVVITSYGLLVTEQELLAKKQWNVAALDEAHTIKNRDTKMSKAAMTLQASTRIALTGTPLQNRLAEIWNIFQFLNPGLLGSFQYFTDTFITPIEKGKISHTEESYLLARDRQRLLKRIISPFILRRTKTDVLSELPEKTEITIRVNLSDEERALYESLRQQAMLAVESGENSAIQALAEITRLRQAACHPQLIDEKLELESSKANAFMELVNNLHVNHHRALVFSQFTSHLALIRRMLDAQGTAYLYLDGQTTAKQRAQLVEQFQTGDTPLFLISLKAGGLGLNLTAADFVIHLDPWWNPAIEDQASDRSYRIGQQKPVTVYRLIAADTIEEKILRLHSHKKSLADALLEGADMSARMTKDDILNLLNEK